MINSVRNTVLSILNKNNYGYISPSDFNLYAKQAQLDIFDGVFKDYNYQVNKENARQSGTGYADIKKGYEEVIDTFSTTSFLTKVGGNIYSAPASSYLLNKVLVYTTTLTTGAVDSVVANQLVDSTATFITDGISVGDIVINTNSDTNAEVWEVSSETVLVLSSDIFPNFGERYTIYSGRVGVNDAEFLSQRKATMLNASLLTTPTEIFPAYSQSGSTLKLYPNSLIEYGRVQCQYIRYPLDPKWTYSALTGGEPMFNQSQPDYQDFELPLDYELELIMKILQYSGMSIREISAVQFAQAVEQKNDMDDK